MRVTRTWGFQPLETHEVIPSGWFFIFFICSFTATGVACTSSSKQFQLRCYLYLLSFCRELVEKVFGDSSRKSPEPSGSGVGVGEGVPSL